MSVYIYTTIYRGVCCIYIYRSVKARLEDETAAATADPGSANASHKRISAYDPCPKAPHYIVCRSGDRNWKIYYI